MDTKITIADLLDARHQNRKIAAVSCYDYTTAQLISQTDVQMILVGDSAAEVVLGFDSTLPATMDFMVAITAAVRRGAPNVFLVSDIFLNLPFLYEALLGNMRANGKLLTLFFLLLKGF